MRYVFGLIFDALVYIGQAVDDAMDVWGDDQ